jgi:hypothetical protein
LTAAKPEKLAQMDRVYVDDETIGDAVATSPVA